MKKDSKIIPEINIDKATHILIQDLQNDSFPNDKVNRSYYKQLPHYRMLKFNNDQLIGYMGLDYRVIRAGKSIYKTLGIISFCVHKDFRGKGIGTTMLSELSQYAKTKDVDFIILLSNLKAFYTSRGFQEISICHSWLRIDEHKNYGIGHEAFNDGDELFIKPIHGKEWEAEHMDWLGYMF